MNPTDGHDDLQVDPALRNALEALKEPCAAAAFRQRLREQFLAAPFEERVVDEDLALGPELAPPEPARFLPERRSEPAAREGRRSPWFSVAAIAAIAAAALIFYRWPAVTGWSVAPSSTFQLVRVDGVEYGSSDRVRLAAKLAPGSRIEVEGGQLVLVLDRRVALSLGADSHFALLSVPEPEVLADLLLRQERGSLAVVTGPDFPGSRLVVQTPQADVRVVGTEFAVDVEIERGTCVCCATGALEVTEHAHPLPLQHAVGTGAMTFVFADGREALQGPLVPDHGRPLEALRQVWTR